MGEGGCGAEDEEGGFGDGERGGIAGILNGGACVELTQILCFILDPSSGAH